MTKGFLAAALSVIVVGLALFASPGESDATFHFTRIDAALAGLDGDANVQYVELRTANAGQIFMSGQAICFFDASGAPYARFTFPGNVTNGADGASILVGTTAFDTAWTVSTPDFTFSAATVTAIAGGADVNHPMRAPGGKISFGTDGTSTPSLMCQGSFSVIDSVAYGTGYTGGVDFGTKFASDLPVSSANGLHLTGPVCVALSAHPCAVPPDNSVDYAIVDENAGANQPRKNAGNLQGPLSHDVDNDGVLNVSDLCPGTAPGDPVDSNGCSAAQVDPDLDGICSPGAPSGGPGPCTGSDNCPAWPNPTQALPAWPVASGDADCDGWPDTVAGGGKAAETTIGTLPGKHCAATPGANNEPPPDAWPVDFNDDQLAGGQDILALAPAFNQHAPGPPYTVRLDLNGDGVVGGQDVLKFGPFFNKRCA